MNRARRATGESGATDDVTLRWSTRSLDERRQLADELAATLTSIRAKDGFASFGLPPETGQLLDLAGPGPVVSFNISEYRCDALLLTKDGILLRELPSMSRDALIDRVRDFHHDLGTAGEPDIKTSERKATEGRLTDTLEWLWDTVAEPVLTALGYQNEPAPGQAWPRVWWAPDGLLGLLPIHAAGYHTDPSGPGRRTIMDRVVSSYTPTIRALHYARRRAPTPARDKALIVAMPTTPGIRGRLANVPAEVSMLRNRLHEAVMLIEPGAPGGETVSGIALLPTKANVFAHLPDCGIAHFACHGATDPADPSNSLLLLHDYQTDPLTVASLAAIKLDRAQLAYLSACSTALNRAVRLADEAIHLTSAFQLAGFPHVIGTLWPIANRVAVAVADAFYENLRVDSGALDTDQAAHALHGRSGPYATLSRPLRRCGPPTCTRALELSKKALCAIYGRAQSAVCGVSKPRPRSLPCGFLN